MRYILQEFSIFVKITQAAGNFQKAFLADMLSQEM